VTHNSEQCSPYDDDELIMINDGERFQIEQLNLQHEIVTELRGKMNEERRERQRRDQSVLTLIGDAKGTLRRELVELRATVECEVVEMRKELERSEMISVAMGTIIDETQAQLVKTANESLTMV
jgi:hypothetical protein